MKRRGRPNKYVVTFFSEWNFLGECRSTLNEERIDKNEKNKPKNKKKIREEIYPIRPWHRVL